MAVKAIREPAVALHACGACGFLWSTAFDRDVSVHATQAEVTALAMQLEQLRPVVLYVLGHGSWRAFHAALGGHVRRDPPISPRPADREFTLLRETCDVKHPAYLEVDAAATGHHGKHRTRLVIAPRLGSHAELRPQFRISPADWRQLQHEQPSCVAVMTPARGISVVLPPADDPEDYIVLRIPSEPGKARAAVAMLREFRPAWHVLAQGYCDPQAMMASVLDDMYERGQLTWTDRTEAAGYLRGELRASGDAPAQ